MGVRKKLNVSVALVEFALVSMLLTGPVLDWLIRHRNIEILHAERVNASSWRRASLWWCME
jgi:hypothetical protein